MKKTFFMAVTCLISLQLFAQNKPEDKSKRASPPATASQKLSNGTLIKIDYSQPSLKGRMIGKDVEPMDGQVWRTGANEATVFNTDKDVKIDGHLLPAGKYGLFTIFKGDEVTFIFNKVWNQWGAFSYKQDQDQLRVKTKWQKLSSPSEKVVFTISPQGKTSLRWGNREASFTIR